MIHHVHRLVSTRVGPGLPGVLLLLLPSAVLGQHAEGGERSALPPRAPALSGIAATPGGNLLVSPPIDGRPGILELTADGELEKTWSTPAGEPVEVVDADAAGRPVVLNARDAKVHVLGEKTRSVSLTDLDGIDPRALAPYVRSGPGDAILIIAADGGTVLRIGPDGGASSIPLSGTTGQPGDFDVSDDGRMAVLDARGKRLRLHAPDGKALSEVQLDGAADGFFGMVRFIPGTNDFWVLELLKPARAGVPPTCALLAYGANGKRKIRIDRYTGGSHARTTIEPAAGIAATRDGVWMGSLEGDVVRMNARGKRLAGFNAMPAPPGISWSEKRRLETWTRLPEDVSTDDLVSALAVHRGRPLESALWERLVLAAPEAAPRMVAATASGTLGSPALAAFFVKTKPQTHEILAAAFNHESPKVRIAAVALLRDPSVTGFDRELARAFNDSDAEIRAASVVVVAKNPWNEATVPLLISRLDDDEPEIARFAAQVLASRLSEVAEPLAAVVKDEKASERKRAMAARTLILDVAESEGIDVLPPDKRDAIRALANSSDVAIRRVGALALAVHGDEAAPAAMEKSWDSLSGEQKRLALDRWSPRTGDAGARTLIRLLAAEKDEAIRPSIFDALARHGTGPGRTHLLKLVTGKGVSEIDRALAIARVSRRLSNAQIVELVGELPEAGPVLRGTVLRLAGSRGVVNAAPAIAALVEPGSDADRAEVYLALHDLGSTAAVPTALKAVENGTADELELSYLASVGGVSDTMKPKFREMSGGTGTSAVLAAEALARSGDATGIARLIDRAKADRYAAGSRDGSLVGALAALGDAGQAAATALLEDDNPATRENGALALALIGGEACEKVRAWGATPRTEGVSIPAAFFAVASCGDAEGAAKLYVRSVEMGRPGDPSLATAEPEAFGVILAELLRQPDFRPKADPVLRAVRMMPKPIVTAVAQSVALDLHPDVAIPAMKYVF